jgi:hypothetical protein
VISVDGSITDVPDTADNAAYFGRPSNTIREEEFPQVLLLAAPLPDCLVGDHDATREHHLLDLPQAQREPVIQPHAVTDDLHRKPNIPAPST